MCDMRPALPHIATARGKKEKHCRLSSRDAFGLDLLSVRCLSPGAMHSVSEIWSVAFLICELFQEHEKTHIGVGKEKSFHCEKCGKVFSSAVSFTAHQNKHEGDWTRLKFLLFFRSCVIKRFARMDAHFSSPVTWPRSLDARRQPYSEPPKNAKKKKKKSGQVWKDQTSF